MSLLCFYFRVFVGGLTKKSWKFLPSRIRSANIKMKSHPPVWLGNDLYFFPGVLCVFPLQILHKNLDVF